MRIIFTFLLLLSLQFASGQVNSIFTKNNSSGCSPLAISFMDLSTGPVTSWYWVFGNGNTSSQQNPGAVYINPGTYIVSLRVSDGVNFNTSYDTVIVHNNPVVDFVASDSIGCANLNISFTNLTLTGTGIASVLWNFGDGSTSTAINPNHVFGPGLFDVTLIVTDSSGCLAQGEKLGYINSISKPNVNFTATNNQNCSAPSIVNFTNTSTNTVGATYFWNFGDGTTSTAQNPVHQYNNYGSFNVMLTVSKNGCKDSIQKNNFVIQTAQDANFSADFTSRCVGQSIQFTDLTVLTPTTRSWNFGDGSPVSTVANPAHVYNTAGVYTVTLTTTKPGCNDVETKLNYITINAIPTADFVSNKTDTCGYPFKVKFTPTTSSVANYEWNFGNGFTSNLQSPTHTYLTPGNFNVSLKVTTAAGCSTTVTKPSFINIMPPLANFAIDSAYGCYPKTIEIADLSTSPNGILSWSWDFGDGSPIQNGPNNPTHTYTDTGIYMIKLAVVDSNGCTDTINPLQKVEVGQELFVDFDAAPTTSCRVTPIAFTNLSDTSLINNVSWRWEFGDGGTDETINPIYQYGDTGVFEVTLIAKHNGCASIISYPNLITIIPPVAEFSTKINCSNLLEVIFTDKSIMAETWLWSINGDSIYTQNTNYTFPGLGTYQATLYVENNTFGCVDSVSRNIVIQEPTLGFYSDDSSGCAPFTVQFTDTSNLAIGWLWYFGDGDTSWAQNPSHLYTDFGEYDVKLVVEYASGCLDSLSFTKMITAVGPIASFASSDTAGCRSFTTSFNDLSSSVAGTITSWKWSFGDGTPVVTTQNPTHTYNQVGTYNVRLITTDIAGCIDTLLRPNYIAVTGPKPVFSNPSSACINTPVSFTNTSTSLGGAINTWNWNFGDGSTSNVQTPNHTYTSTGIYTVSLYLKDDNGCDTTLVKQNIITIDSLTVDFSADSTIGNCTGFIVNFAQMASPNPISWSWDFGNGNLANIANPSTVFSNVGSFDVSLIVTSASGCVDTIVKPNFITVKGPTGVLSISEDTGCIDMVVDFNIVSPNSVNQIWDFGDGTVITNGLLDYSYTYTDASTFYPLVILMDSAGCLVPYYFDTIYTGSLEVDMYMDKNYVCAPDIISFADSSQSVPPINNWFWDFGDGATSTLQNPNHNYNTEGVYDVSLIVSNGLCADTIIQTQAITSDSSTLAKFDFTLPTLVCPPVSIPFNNLSSADSTIVSYDWDFGNGSTSSNQNPSSPNFTTAGKYFITLNIETVKGCVSTYIDSLVINPIPFFEFELNDFLLCLDRDTTLPIIHNTANITWMPSTNLSCSDCPNPTIYGVNSEIYYVNGTNEFGCTYDDTLVLTVGDLPPLTVSDDQRVLIGTEVNMSASSPGVTNFMWSPSESLTCTNCPEQTIIATETTPFVVTIADTFGCKNIDTILIEVFNMCDENFLLFPNVFTPNGDNKNDVFKVSSLMNLKPQINSFRIFDRWGKLIFETKNLNDSWDGKYKGNYLNNGVYVYVVDVVCSDGGNQVFQGNVTLYR